MRYIRVLKMSWNLRKHLHGNFLLVFFHVQSNCNLLIIQIYSCLHNGTILNCLLFTTFRKEMKGFVQFHFVRNSIEMDKCKKRSFRLNTKLFILLIHHPLLHYQKNSLVRIPYKYPWNAAEFCAKFTKKLSTSRIYYVL